VFSQLKDENLKKFSGAAGQCLKTPKQRNDNFPWQMPLSA
jgi:hypothetical protein